MGRKNYTEKNLLINRIEKKVLLAEENMVRVTLSILVIVMFLQVFFRYVIERPLGWTEEVGRFIFVYLAMFGSAVAIKRHEHFAISFFTDILPIKARKIIEVISVLLSMVFFVLLIIHGYRLGEMLMGQHTAVLKLPTAVPYAAIPVGAVLILFHLFVYMINIIYDKTLIEETEQMKIQKDIEQKLEKKEEIAYDK